MSKIKAKSGGQRQPCAICPSMSGARSSRCADHHAANRRPSPKYALLIRNALLLFLVGALWGLLPPLSRMAALEGANPVGLAFWANAIGGSVLIGFSLLRARRIPLDRRALTYYLVCGLLGAGFGDVLTFWAAHHLQAGVIAIAMAFETFMVFALAAGFGLERACPRRLFGIVFGLAGVMFLVLPDGGLPGSGLWLWVLVALGAPLCYALEDVFIAARRPIDLSPTVLVGGMLVAAALMLLPAVLVFDAAVPLSLSFGRLEWIVLGLALMTGIAYALFVELIDRAGPVFASQSAYTITLGGVAWGIVLLSERHSLWVWAALVLMCVGLVLVNRPEEAGETPRGADPKKERRAVARAPRGRPVRLDYPSAETFVAAVQPRVPTFLFRPHVLCRDVADFSAAFAGRIFYPVKTNPDPRVLSALHQAGIDAFDVASIPEHERVAELCPGSELAFTHPVAPEHALMESTRRFGVTRLTVDHQGQLDRLRRLGLLRGGMTVFVRVATHSTSAIYDLSTKFGCPPAEAVSVLRRVSESPARLGIAMHVGSQTRDPRDFLEALSTVKAVADQAGVTLHALNIGGGFPVPYGADQATADQRADGAIEILRSLRRELGTLGLAELRDLSAEPGRSLVARALSMVVRVEFRKEPSRVHINAGIWQGISEALTGSILFPARLLGRRSLAPLAPFQVFGATCDSVDRLSTPLWLPADVSTGDFVEIGHLGAYSSALMTDFNGMGAFDQVTVGDDFATPNLETAAPSQVATGIDRLAWIS